MRTTIILGGAVLALLAGDCCAQGMLDGASGAAPSATTKSQYTPPPPKGPASSRTATGERPTTSKVTFHSRPAGAKITLPDGKSCTAPCSLTIGFNEKFTAVATKRGYRAKEFDVSPSVTDVGRAQIIGSAIGAGVIGLVVGAAMADRAYGPEPFVVELVPDSGGGSASTPTAVASASASAPSRSAQSPSSGQRMLCTPRGCEPVKAGCRVEQPDLASGSTIGGQSAVVVCR